MAPPKKETGHQCCVPYCKNSWGQDRKNNTKRSYHSFPSMPKRRNLWLKAINRGEDWQPSKYSCVCGDHFIGGKKTDQPGSPGYVPILFPPENKIIPVGLYSSATGHTTRLAGWSNVAGASPETPPATVGQIEEQREFRISGKKFYTGQCCSAPGCSNTSGKDRQLGIKRSYFGYPMKDEKRLKLWLKAIPWDKWKPTRHHKICADHFVGGVKSNVVGNPAYVPTLFPRIKELRKEKASNRKEDVKQQRLHGMRRADMRRCRATIEEGSASYLPTIFPPKPAPKQLPLPKKLPPPKKPPLLRKPPPAAKWKATPMSVATLSRPAPTVSGQFSAQARPVSLVARVKQAPQVYTDNADHDYFMSPPTPSPQNEQDSSKPMQVHCALPGCNNSALYDSHNGIVRSYYTFPSGDQERLNLWLLAIPESASIKLTGMTWICSDHFIGGKKTDSKSSAGYVPTIFPNSRKRKGESNLNPVLAKQIQSLSNPNVRQWTFKEAKFPAPPVRPQIRFQPIQPKAGTPSFAAGVPQNYAEPKKIFIIGPRPGAGPQPRLVTNVNQGLTRYLVPGKSLLQSQPGLITVPTPMVLQPTAVNSPAAVNSLTAVNSPAAINTQTVVTASTSLLRQSLLAPDDIVLSGFAQPKLEPEDHVLEDTMSVGSPTRDDSMTSDELLLSGLVQPKLEPEEPILDDSQPVSFPEAMGGDTDLCNATLGLGQVQEVVPDNGSPVFVGMSLSSGHGTRTPENIEEIKIKMETMEDKEREDRCTVPGCLNNSTGDALLNIRRHYFTYPIEDPTRLKLWLQVIDRINWMPAWDSKICSDHFAGGQKTPMMGSKGYFPMVALPAKRSQGVQNQSLQEGTINFQATTSSGQTSVKTVTLRKVPFVKPKPGNGLGGAKFSKDHIPSPVSMFANTSATSDLKGPKPKTLATFTGYMDCPQCIYGFEEMNQLANHLVLKHLKYKALNATPEKIQSQPKALSRIPVQIDPQSLAKIFQCSQCGMVLNHAFLLKAHLEQHEREKLNPVEVAPSITTPREILPLPAQASMSELSSVTLHKQAALLTGQPQKTVSLVIQRSANKAQSATNLQAQSASSNNPMYKMVSASGSQPKAVNASPSTMTNETFQNLISMIKGSLNTPSEQQSVATISSGGDGTKKRSVILIKQKPSSGANTSLTTQSAVTVSSDSVSPKKPSVIVIKSNQSSNATTPITPKSVASCTIPSAAPQSAVTVSSDGSTQKASTIVIKRNSSSSTTTPVAPQSEVTVSSDSANTKKPPVIVIKRYPTSNATTPVTPQSAVAVSSDSASTKKPSVIVIKKVPLSDARTLVAPQFTAATSSSSGTGTPKRSVILIKQNPSSSAPARSTQRSLVTVQSGSAGSSESPIIVQNPSSSALTSHQGPAMRKRVYLKDRRNSPLILILPPRKRSAQSILDAKSRQLRKAMYIQKSALDRTLADVLEAKRKQENEPAEEPGQVVICHACQSFYSSPTEFAAHMHRRHRKGPESKIYCEVCNQEFLSYANLMDHISPLCPKARAGVLHCKPCEQSFSTPAELRGHLQISHPENQRWCYTCKPPVKLHSALALSLHKSEFHRKKPMPKLRQCEICGYQATYPSTLRIHMDAHKPLEEQKYHTKVPHQCDICGRVLGRNKNGLIRHMRTHTGEKPFSCLQCPKTFATKPNFAIHMRYHNGIRPYSCDVCDKTFLVKGNMRVHKRTHHAGPSAKVEPGEVRKRRRRIKKVPISM